MKRINLFGGPGSGKSTVAAHLFARLKIRGYDVELVNEWIKTWAWQGIKPTGFDQLYNFAKQLRREEIVLRHGGLVVSDAPIMMQLAYVGKYAPKDMLWLYHDLSSIASSYEYRYPSLNILLKRMDGYNPLGRYQTLEEAQDIDIAIRRMLDAKTIPHATMQPNELECIEEYVIQNLNKEDDDGVSRSGRSVV